MFLIVGLGNPGDKYEMTRHNVGRIVLQTFLKSFAFPPLEKSKNAQALYTWTKLGKHRVEVMFPETFMNKSGVSAKYAASKHNVKPERIIVVYDDIDLPLGGIKISYGRGSGGHRGVESIIRALQTKNFVRIRIGVASTTPGGKIKKPKGEQKVLDFLMGDFKPKEQTILKRVAKDVCGAIESVLEKGHTHAMNIYN